MGSVTYDFLANSLLFENAHLEDGFEGITDSELEKELERYRQFCDDHAGELFSEVDSRDSSLVVLSDEPLETVHLTQAALYVNQYLFEDPLLKMLDKPTEASRVMSEYLGMSRDDGLDRSKLVL